MKNGKMCPVEHEWNSKRNRSPRELHREFVLLLVDVVCSIFNNSAQRAISEDCFSRTSHHRRHDKSAEELSSVWRGGERWTSEWRKNKAGNGRRDGQMRSNSRERKTSEEVEKWIVKPCKVWNCDGLVPVLVDHIWQVFFCSARCVCFFAFFPLIFFIFSTFLFPLREYRTEHRPHL